MASATHRIFCKVLRFFNLVDRSCNLSISNIAVIVLIVKIALAATFDWPTAAALLMTLLNYGHKRVESNKAIKDEAKASDNASIHAELKDLKSQLQAQSELQDVIKKQAEDTAAILGKANLAQLAASFKPMFGKKD